MKGTPTTRPKGQKAFKWVSRNLMFAAFVVTFGICIFAVIPQALSHWDALLHGPPQGRLEGTLRQEVATVNGTVLEPVPGALVEIGGFSVRTDAAGHYDLTFRMEKGTSVLAVVVTVGNTSTVHHISWPPGQNSGQEDLIL